ncbi:kinase-like domain-containing protein [Rhizophagus irregularis DAOM 181602=DAOM 197198]|nr:kinase-like domain-containing protein [Rhizophagus irregularis DAOM 181602=DAOM 197198]
MSDIKNNKVTVNTNEWINWIEENIFKNNLKYYDYNDFLYIEKFCNGNFGNFYRVKWKNSDHYFILKSFNIDNVDIKEIVQEIKLYREIDSHENIINFCGITNKENHNDQAKEYLLVMEDVDGRSLRSYLKENFKNLTWEDKYKLAYQLTYTISFLHDKGIIHGDLNSGNILVHRNTTIKLVDLGLSNRIKEISKQSSDLLDKIPYIDPKCLIVESNNIVRSFIFNEKSDVYSIGVLLWEISSGKSPFEGKLYDSNLVNQILQGYRETIVSNTPLDYSNLYIECWNGESDNRPVMNQIISKLREIIKIQTDDNEKLGYCYSMGIGTEINMKKAFKLYQKAADLGNIRAQCNLINLYLDGDGTEKDYNKAFELAKKSAEDHSDGMNLLGYCYNNGIGTNIDKKKAFELFQEAAKLECCDAQYNLALMYEDGEGIKQNIDQAIYWYKKSANQGFQSAQNKLKYLGHNN